MNDNLGIGTIIEHDRYGQGTIVKNNLADYDVVFDVGGRRNILKSKGDFEVIEQAEQTSGKSGISLNDVKKVMELVLERNGILQHEPELGEKWINGTLTLNPANASLQGKEIPIEVFFHKIVMLRDRLRVLEQQINSHPKLDDEDRVNLQQYITRCYGSLTTFNVLFKEKADYFVGSGKEN